MEIIEKMLNEFMHEFNKKNQEQERMGNHLPTAVEWWSQFAVGVFLVVCFVTLNHLKQRLQQRQLERIHHLNAQALRCPLDELFTRNQNIEFKESEDKTVSEYSKIFKKILKKEENSLIFTAVSSNVELEENLKKNAI